MQVLPSFDPSLVMNGQINASSVDPGSKILLYNLSIYTLQLNFDNGDSALLHAFEANYWVLDGSTTLIDWIQYGKLTTTGTNSSIVTATMYRSDETITGIYPMSLVYQLNIGNVVTTSGGSMAQLINDGNPAGTTLIESTVAGKASTTILTNDGLLNIVTLIAGTLTQLIKTQNTGNPLLLGAINAITEIIGNLMIDQNLIVTGTTQSNGSVNSSGNITASGFVTSGNGNNIQASGQLNSVAGLISLASKICIDYSGTDLAIIASSSNGFLKEGGTNVAEWNTNGFTLFQKLILSNAGTLAGISAFTGVGTGTYSHGFGRLPAFFIITTDVVGSQTVGYDSPNTTQVHITCGASLGFKCYCID